MIGAPGEGLKIAFRTLDHTRITIGAQAVGLAQGALDVALDYVKERKQFGKRIADFQGIQFMLADMAMSIETARQMVYVAAAKSEREDSDLTFFSAAAKCYASDVAMKVTTDAVQLLGGCGLHRGLPARADDARRQDHPDLRGHQPDPARGHGPSPAGGLSPVTAPSARIRPTSTWNQESWVPARPTAVTATRATRASRGTWVADGARRLVQVGRRRRATARARVTTSSRQAATSASPMASGSPGSGPKGSPVLRDHAHSRSGAGGDRGRGEQRGRPCRAGAVDPLRPARQR